MDLTETDSDNEDWIQVALDRSQWRSLEKTVFSRSIKATNFWSSDTAKRLLASLRICNMEAPLKIGATSTAD